MHTSAGIVGEEIVRTGRSGQPLLAVCAAHVPATSNRTTESWWTLMRIADIANDYNRCYPKLEFGNAEGLWYPDAISARRRWPLFLLPRHGARLLVRQRTVYASAWP